jgi:hypothetical protein
MRELAYIQQIKALKPIAGADSIECAEILGWEVVVKKGDFKVNDLVVYCEIDSILPDLSCFEFLRSKKFRIRTVKLRGQISQGIAFPLSVLTDVDPAFNLKKIKLGQDVTEALKIVKYDPESALDDEIPQANKSWIANKWSFIKWKLFKIKPVRAGGFPQDVPKTDETRVQKMGGLLEKREGELVYITEKCEGSSCTFVYRCNDNWFAKLLGKDHIFQVCSRNRIVYDSRTGGGETNKQFYPLAAKYNLLAGLKRLNRNLAIQGECVGPGVQGNIYQLPEYELRAFLIYDLDAKKYLPFNETFTLMAQLGLASVPVITSNVKVVNDIKYYVELSKDNSVINPKVKREGIVIRAMNGEFSFKSINPEYLLKQN